VAKGVKAKYSVARTLAKPTYRTPKNIHELGQPIPRVVNEWWIVLALRAQASAAARGNFLPFDDVALQRRAAIVIERLFERLLDRRVC
jgi:hypothetical protein